MKQASMALPSPSIRMPSSRSEKARPRTVDPEAAAARMSPGAFSKPCRICNSGLPA